LLIAVILSLIALVWRASQPELSVLGREPGRFTFSDTRKHPENRTIPGLLILRPDEGLFFANADALHNEIMSLVEETQPQARVVLIDLEMSNQLDVPAVDMLVELREELARLDLDLWLARVHKSVTEMLERSGFIQQLGPEKIHSRNLDSIMDYLSRIAPDELEDITLVTEGLNLTMEVIEIFLSHSTGEQRQVLEAYHQKMAELLQATEANSAK
jgi:SulP family sulfate permease